MRGKPRVTVEARFQAIVSAQSRTLPDLASEAVEALARLSRERTLQGNVERLRGKRTRGRLLTNTVARMHEDDLDSAWHAVMMGDVDRALRIMARDVPSASRPGHKGTPWRMSGWLSKR